MDRVIFLTAVIDDGIKEINDTYTRPDQQLKKEGGLKGFEECRGKSDAELEELFFKAKSITNDLRMDQDDRLPYFSMREQQIGWVINVLSAKAYMAGQPTMVTPTSRGALKAVDVVTRHLADAT
jgi:hypothetical protein